MQILTPTGNKPIEEIQVGDDVLAFDMVTGASIINQVLEKTLWNYSPESPFFDGKFYIINGTWKCYGEQSIWRNDNQVVHIKNLVVGDIIFNGSDEDVVVTSIEEITDIEWYKFEISGDHSYIVDNLTLHNASRFWVGGTGTWDNATTTHWSATTGGGGGSSVPGSADSVTFDGASGGGTITLNYAPSITGLTGGAHTGTFDTGNNNINCSSGFNYSGTGTRTLTLGTSTITLTGGSWTMTTTTGLTFNGSNATISMTSKNATFTGGGLAYNIVSVTATGGGGITFLSANTFTTLTIRPSGNGTITVGADQSVSGLFTVDNITSSVGNAGLLAGGSSTGVFTKGNARTISAGSVSLANTTFADIVGTGAATWTGTNIGDGGGNSNITFTTPVTRYWVDTNGGSWQTTASWSTTSGGASGATIPLPQDTAIFDANSITTGSSTITLNQACLPSVDFTNVLNSPTISHSLANGVIYIFGDITYKTGLTVSGTTQTQFCNHTGGTITTAGLTTTYATVLNTTGTYTMNGNLLLSGTPAITQIVGTFDADNYNITGGSFSSANTNTRVVNMGSGTWTMTGTGTVWGTTGAGITLNPGTSTIDITDTSIASKTFTGGSLTYYNLKATGDNIIVSGSNTFNTLNLNNAGLTTGLSLTAGTTQTVSSMTNNGSAGNLTKLISTSAGTPATISKTSGTVSLDYMSIKDSTATGGAIFYAGANSTNVSGNTGWFFTAAPTGGSGVTIGNSIANSIINGILI